jgi:hypothetical protein
VVVSGYVAILFGRNRTSEDVDIIVEKIDFNTFLRIWTTISDRFYCINTKKRHEAYEEYLCDGISVRFAKKNTFIPNIELKFPKNNLDEWTLKERIKILLNNHYFYTSPLELQISFKLHLGSEKDIEDAKFLYALFHETLDMSLLQDFNRKLKTESLYQRYLL